MINEESLYRSLGESVRSARRAAGMSQEKLADAVGLTRPSIANIESGVQRPPLHVLANTAAVLGVSLGVLLQTADDETQSFANRAFVAEARVHELEAQIETAKRRAALLFAE